MKVIKNDKVEDWYIKSRIEVLQLDKLKGQIIEATIVLQDEPESDNHSLASLMGKMMDFGQPKRPKRKALRILAKGLVRYHATDENDPRFKQRIDELLTQLNTVIDNNEILTSSDSGFWSKDKPTDK